MFVRIREYVANQPLAADGLPAALWVLETAREFGWEVDAQSAADAVLSHPAADPESRRAAWQVRALAAAKQGAEPAAQAAFAEFLQSLRLRQPNEAAVAAQSLSLAWQLQGKIEPATAVYEQLRSAYFLNDEIRQFTESRLQRLQLVGRPAPEIDERDLEDRPVEPGDFQGHITLVDFWATNCRPCLVELPRLKHLHAQFTARGVSFLGVSFDDDASLLAEFIKTQGIGWRQVQGRESAEQRFQVSLIPCLMVIDRQGHIAAVDIRPADLHLTLAHFTGIP